MLEMLAHYAVSICQILTCAALFITPVRERLLGMEALREGQRCLLRSQIVGLYYRRCESRQLREFEFRNLEHCYRAYKTLGGNSFIDHIYKEMQNWDIVPA